MLSVLICTGHDAEITRKIDAGRKVVVVFNARCVWPPMLCTFRFFRVTIF